MRTELAPNRVDELPPTERLADAAAGGRPIITTGHERALRVELDRLRHHLEVEFAERLREARERQARPDIAAKLAAIQTAYRHQGPTGDIDQMLSEIERGYLAN